MRTASGTFSPNFPVRVRCSLVKTPKMFHCTKLPHTDGESPHAAADPWGSVPTSPHRRGEPNDHSAQAPAAEHIPT